MEKPVQTKYKFANAIKDLMRYHELDKISVTDIVAKSGSTRQTFYRHFQDKYDLVNWYFELLVNDSFQEMKVNNLKDALVKKFKFIEKEKYFFKAAFSSKDYNSLMEYDYKYILNFYTQIIYNKTKEPLSPQIKFLLEMYCRGSIAMTANWTGKDKKETPEEMSELLVEALPVQLRNLLIEFI